MSNVRKMKENLKKGNWLVTNNSRRNLSNDEIKRRHGLMKSDTPDPCFLTKAGLLLLAKAHGFKINPRTERKALCQEIRRLLQWDYVESPHASENVRNLAQVYEEASPKEGKGVFKKVAAALTALLLLGSGLKGRTVGSQLALPAAHQELMPYLQQADQSKAIMLFDNWLKAVNNPKTYPLRGSKIQTIMVEKPTYPLRGPKARMPNVPSNKSKALMVYTPRRKLKGRRATTEKQQTTNTHRYIHTPDTRPRTETNWKKLAVAAGALTIAMLKKKDYTPLDTLAESIDLGDHVVVLMPRAPSKNMKLFVATLRREMGSVLSILEPTSRALEYLGVGDAHLPHFFVFKDGQKVYEANTATPKRTLLLDAIGGVLGCAQPREDMPSPKGEPKTPLNSMSVIQNRFTREMDIFYGQRMLVQSNLGKRRGRALVIILGKLKVEAVKAKYPARWLSVIKMDAGLKNSGLAGDVVVLRGDDKVILNESDDPRSLVRLALWGALEC